MSARAFLALALALQLLGGSVGAQQSGSIITTVAGGMSGQLVANATCMYPTSLATDLVGNVYIVESLFHRVWLLNVTTGLAITLAGNGGYPRFSGDGGPATGASVGGLYGVAVDASGFFITDNSRIRRVALGTGIITTVAGNDEWGFSGDGGPATNARLTSSGGVALDTSGNLFIIDSDYYSGSRIRRVAAGTGLITTVAGNGTRGFSGDGGPATSASLNEPTGIAVDGDGNLFIAFGADHRIRRVAFDTGIITTVAGNGTRGFSGDGGSATSATLSSPYQVAVDGGNLLIADSSNKRIRRVTLGNGIITTVAGTGEQGFSGDGGPGTSARLHTPFGVAVDGGGNLLIADTNNYRIRRVAAGTGIITTVAGIGEPGSCSSGDGGPAASAGLLSPHGMAVDGSGHLFFADESGNRIRRVALSTGIVTTVAGNGVSGFSGDGGPATSSSLSGPRGVAVDGSGHLFFADESNNRIRRVELSTGIVTTVAGNGVSGFSGDGGPATSSSLSHPSGIAFDGSGNLLIADTENGRIRRVENTGIITTVAGGVRYDDYRVIGDGGPATNASLSHPRAVAVDVAGNMFIADYYHMRIRRVAESTGVITTVVGHSNLGSYSGDGGPATSASLWYPTGIALGGDGLFIADSSNHCIRRVALNTGIITTVVGTGTFGFSGDGGHATSATLLYPQGVAVGGGYLFIADSGNKRIRLVDLIVTPTASVRASATGTGSSSLSATRSPPSSSTGTGTGSSSATRTRALASRSRSLSATRSKTGSRTRSRTRSHTRSRTRSHTRSRKKKLLAA
jgi:sugar lactone lactonase YvrE